MAEIEYLLLRTLTNPDEVHYIFKTCRDLLDTQRFGEFYFTLGYSPQEDEDFCLCEESKIGEKTKKLAQKICANVSHIQDLRDIGLKLTDAILGNKKALKSGPFSDPNRMSRIIIKCMPKATQP